MKQSALDFHLENCVITKEDCTSPTLALKWARERHKVYLKRRQGKGKPWTQDPFLQNYRFCNLYREIDAVSEIFIKNIIRPFEDTPYLWYLLAIARTINHPDTVMEIINEKAWSSPDKMYKIMQARAKRGEQVFTGAYLVNSVFQSYDGNVPREKSYYVAYLNLGKLYENRKSVQPYMSQSMEAAVSALKTQRGYGPFVAYQVAVDLSYSRYWLKNAPDINTFNSPGPGTCRGLARMFGGQSRTTGFKKQPKGWYQEKILELYDIFQKQSNWKTDAKDPHKGFSPVSLSNISNACCESDKMARLFLGEGEPRSRYKGTI